MNYFLKISYINQDFDSITFINSYDLFPDEIEIVNKYKPYLHHILSLYNNYLNTPAFKNRFDISKDSFLQTAYSRVHQTSDNSNKLQFKEDTHKNPGLGIYLLNLPTL